MMHRHHTLAGMGLTFVGVSTVHVLATRSGATSSLLQPFKRTLEWFASSSVGHGFGDYLYLTVSIGLVMLGSLLPDIDHGDSRLGRYFHLPVRHRGVTHSDWVILIGLIASLFDPTRLFVWLIIGIITHDLLDELSKAGRVHFYPFTDYAVVKHGSSETVVKPKWHGLYTTGKASESTVFWMIMFGCAVWSAFMLKIDHQWVVDLLT